MVDRHGLVGLEIISKHRHLYEAVGKPNKALGTLIIIIGVDNVQL